MIIIDVHARDIVDRFVRDSVLEAREFDWESQLRFYWEKSLDSCCIRQCTGQFEYGYEYMVSIALAKGQKHEISATDLLL